MLTEAMLTRRAGETVPSTFNAEERTFEALISSGATVGRRDARGAFNERLDLSTVDLESLVGLPVLDGHRQNGSEHVVGTIVAVRREGAGIIAKFRLSAADDVRNVATKIGEGSLRGVSIGYSAAERSEGADKSTGRRTVTIKPKILEVSIVPIPADPLALIRSNDMPELITPEDRAEHRAHVRTIARQSGLSSDWADEQIDGELTITEVRAAAYEALQQRTNVNVRTQVRANDDPAVITTRRADAVYARVSGTAPSEEARPFMGDRLVDHARAALIAAGHSVTGMDQDAIFRAAMHTTSDFPQMLTSVGNRTLMQSYQAAESPLKMLARQSLHSDFRAATRLKLSGIGKLEKVNEAGEIKSTSRGEASESFALDTYGSMFALSRKALINDDLGAFRDWGVAAGRAAAETESGLLFDLLTQSGGAGPVLGEDGKRMFHADHGNLASPASILSGTSLDAARLAMRRQKDLDGKTPIRVTPKYLLTGPEMESAAEQLLATINPATVDDVNPHAGKLSLLVEPRLVGTGWYIFADPAVLAALEYAYLSSAQGPQIASREGWDVLGMEFRVTLDFGCGPVDFRGTYRNAGA